jgi:hypothetical protein
MSPDVGRSPHRPEIVAPLERLLVYRRGRELNGPHHLIERDIAVDASKSGEKIVSFRVSLCVSIFVGNFTDGLLPDSENVQQSERFAEQTRTCLVGRTGKHASALPASARLCLPPRQHKLNVFRLKEDHA